MKVLLALGVALALSVASCTAPHKAAGPWFRTAQAAVKHECQAFWVGLYENNTHETQIQWETRRQYQSGSGQVAQIQHTAQGYRVINCRVAFYTHG